MTTTYSYDPLHRLLTKTYTDNTPAVHINYDELTAWNQSLTNSIGRRSSIYSTPPNQSFNASEIFSYDAVGNVITNSQCTPSNCGTASFAITYGYDLAGDITSYSNGAGITFTESYNRAQLATSLTSTYTGGPSSLFSAAHYSPFGSLSSAQYGNSLYDSRQYTPRGFLQALTVSTVLYVPGVAGSGTVSISGSEQSKTVCVITQGGQVCHPAYDNGTLNATVNGFKASASWGGASTASSVASALASSFNGSTSSPVTASANGSAVALTAKTTGTNTNYSLSASVASWDSTDFSSPSFTPSTSGATLTGGITQQGPGTVLYSVSMTYSGNGSILSANDSVNGNWTYTYDSLSQIATASGPSSAFSYSYDRFGNRWQQTVTRGSGPAPGFTFNNLTNRIDGWSYDAAGNLLNDGSCSYSYDAEERITSVGTCASASYVYDGEGRRVRKTTSANGTVDFLYNLAGQEIVEANTSGGANRQEVFIGGRHLATFRNGTAYFIHSDWLGTERARTNTSAAIATDNGQAATYSSLPFGDGLSQVGVVSPLHFGGKDRDPESNLDYFGARYYNSAEGRFMSPDPEQDGARASDPHTWNAYAYALNDPLNVADPTGRDECKPQQSAAAMGDCQNNDVGGATGTVGTNQNNSTVQSRAQLNIQVIRSDNLSENGRNIVDGQLSDLKADMAKIGISVNITSDSTRSNIDLKHLEPSTFDKGAIPFFFVTSKEADSATSASGRFGKTVGVVINEYTNASDKVVATHETLHILRGDIYSRNPTSWGRELHVDWEVFKLEHGWTRGMRWLTNAARIPPNQ